MRYYDQVVIDISHVIESVIETYHVNGVSRDLISVNILSQLRHLLEHVFLQIYCHSCKPDYFGPKDEYETIHDEAIPFVKKKGQYRWLLEWHGLLQRTNSHYTTKESDGSRLLLHYFDYLVLLQKFEKNNYGIEIIPNLHSYPFHLDSGEFSFYSNIASLFAEHKSDCFHEDDEPYYVTNRKVIKAQGSVFFELTLIPANDHSDKFNRITVYTEEDVMTQFAVKGAFYETTTFLLGREIDVVLFKDWKISIRPCELAYLAGIVGVTISASRGNPLYAKLVKYCQEQRMGLNDFFTLPQNELDTILSVLFPRDSGVKSFLLTGSRLVRERALGWKTFLYLSACPRNATIKAQYPVQGKALRNTPFNLSTGCYTFEMTPFSASLVKHNPSFSVLIRCFDPSDREEELLAAVIRNKSLFAQDIFVPQDELLGFGSDIDSSITKYNRKVIDEMKIRKFKKFYYLDGVLGSTKTIIEALASKIGNGIAGYSATSASYYSSLVASKKDDPDKEKAITQLFESNRVAFIYGPAGTGKTTFISWVCEMFASVPKIIATQTKSSLDHLKRVCNARNSSFYTLSQLKNSKQVLSSKLFIVDECSMADNLSIMAILNKLKCEAMLFAGDIGQLEPIRFGNWFVFAKYFFSKHGAVFELTNKYRTKKKQLIDFWDAVRETKSDAEIGAIINRNGYSKKIDESLFKSATSDEITLCLNYDGVFGINCINGYLQADNKNDPIVWCHKKYKIGDPILFIDNTRFHDLLYNNLKGRIIDIVSGDKKISFTVSVDRIINALDIPDDSEIELLDTRSSHSIVRFPVYAWSENHDDDNRSSFCIVPFQVAYAVSIHKAQGLEYDSVKVVISDSIDDNINLNIFYTAITRAKEELSIFWSPESEKKILSSLTSNNHCRDVFLFIEYCKNH